MFTQQEHANSIQVLWVPFFKGAAAAQAQEGREELLHVQGQEGRPRGDTPHLKWLRFAGAAVKRCPTFKVRETQVRRSVLREGIRGQTD